MGKEKQCKVQEPGRNGKGRYLVGKALEMLVITFGGSIAQMHNCIEQTQTYTYTTQIHTHAKDA